MLPSTNSCCIETLQTSHVTLLIIERLSLCVLCDNLFTFIIIELLHTFNGLVVI